MNTMLYSAEVRWFFRGNLPAGIQDWFTAGRAITPDKRTDAYLLFPGCESIGVKQREGKFEIKALRGGSETARYGDQVTGRIETWVKWSYAGEGIDAFLAGLRNSPAGWLPVEKRRWLRKFSLDNQKPEEVAVNTLPDEGGNIELTTVRAQQSDWWTIGLEAFGDKRSVRANLDMIAAHIFTKNEPPRPLDTTRSCSYPVWLNSFA